MKIPLLKPGSSFAHELDKNDRLKSFRNKFYIPDDNIVYLDGNSLGRLPIETKTLLQDVTEKQWGTELIESWNNHWYYKSSELGNKIAQIIGASQNEVMVCDSTSQNLYKLAFSALKLQKNKYQIVSDEINFPTDLYILQGIIEHSFPEHTLSLVKSVNGISVEENELLKKIDYNTALVVLSLVSFKSSFLYDAKKITEHAHKKGALVLWDLSHAAGAIPVKLNEINADLAVGCTYKYLNGGPGAPAYLYIKNELQHKLNSPVQGWFADKNPFAFDLEFKPAKGIQKFLAGTPPVLSLMAIEPGLDIILDAGMENIHNKSILLSEYFIFLVKHFLQKLEVDLASPENFINRGSHISVKHDEAYRICQALIHPKNNTHKIIPDFRDPDIIRFGFTPLYTTFKDVWITVQRLKEIISKKEFRNFSSKRKTVT